jgi:PAS domain S-box-containing protein
MGESKILVVEDERITAEDMKSGLEEAGYHVQAIVSSGKKAIEKAGELKPDIVLMDIRLEGKMDGIEAAGQIRQLYDIPVIYVTAYSDNRTLERAQITEPSGYIIKEQTGLITKPFVESELQNAIEKTLHRHIMERDHDMIISEMLKNKDKAVIATNADWRIKLMNSAAETLTGWKADETVGKDFREVFEPSDNNNSFNNTPSTTLKLDNSLFKSKKGDNIPVKGSLKTINNENGDMDGLIFVFNHLR